LFIMCYCKVHNYEQYRVNGEKALLNDLIVDLESNPSISKFKLLEPIEKVHNTYTVKFEFDPRPPK
jgi:hypothetical protein